MGVMSGKLGTAAGGGSGVAPITTLRNWKVTETIESKVFVASNTNLGTGRRPGVLDWTGSFQQYGWFPQVMPADKGLFNGFQGPTSGVPGSFGHTIRGNYICDNINVVLNWGGAELQTITTSLLSDGALSTVPATTGIMDDSAPATVPSGEGHVEIANVLTPLAFQSFCTLQATFNLLVQMHPYSNSCGYDAPKKAMTRKREAGAVDWNLALSSDDVTFYNNGLFPVGTFVLVKLFVNAVDHWALNYGIVDNYSDFNVNRETGELISYTMNILMSADKDGTPPVPADGFIKMPSISTPWWPPTGALLRKQFEEERYEALKKNNLLVSEKNQKEFEQFEKERIAKSKEKEKEKVKA